MESWRFIARCGGPGRRNRPGHDHCHHDDAPHEDDGAAMGLFRRR
jgi:hypothetical protein